MKNVKPLHEALKLAVANCFLQTQNVDVAVPLIAGAPGGGKTQSIQALCNERGWACVSTHFAQKPLEEFGGIPQFKWDTFYGEDVLATEWSFPDIMKELYKTAEKYPTVVWLLDDIHLCSAVHFSLLYELLTERKIRDYHLPQNVCMILAGNHGSSKAGAKTMLSAIVNRVSLMPIFTDFESWKRNFALENVHPAVVSFLENEKYKQFFHEEEQVDTPWCSPRSWTRFSNMIKYFEWEQQKPLAEDLVGYLAESHVGTDAAAEFIQYYGIFTKFDIEQILADIDNYELPEDAVDKHALAHAAIAYYTSKKNRNQLNQPFAKFCYKYLKQYPDLGLMICQELISLEKVLKKEIYVPISKELNKLESGITRQFVDEITGV